MSGMVDKDLRWVLCNLMQALMESEGRLAPKMRELIEKVNVEGDLDVRKALVAIMGEVQMHATGKVQKLARRMNELIIKRWDVGEDVRMELRAITEELREQEREREVG